MERFLKAVGVITIAILALCVFAIAMNVYKIQVMKAGRIAAEREVYSVEEVMSGKAGQPVPQDQLPEELRTK
jgi:hypothetical protein